MKRTTSNHMIHHNRLPTIDPQITILLYSLNASNPYYKNHKNPSLFTQQTNKKNLLPKLPCEIERNTMEIRIS